MSLPAAAEPFASEATRLLRDLETGRIELLVDLFWPELDNVLCKAVRQLRVDRTTAEAAIDRALALELATMPSGPLLKWVPGMEISGATLA